MWPLMIFTVVFALLSQLFAPASKKKANNLDDFDFPTIEDGSPVQYVAGRVKINSVNLTWYGDFSSRPIKKGSLFKQLVGYKYFLGFMLSVCLGPGVVLKKLWFGNDEPIFDGTLTDGDEERLSNPGAFGGDSSGGGYDLYTRFYAGSNSQTADAYLTDKIDGPVPGWRGMAYLVMHGYIGNNTNLQQVSVEVQRTPDPLSLGSKALIGTEGDVNPANVLYELFTNSFGALGFGPSEINEASFVAAGNTLYDEDEGISCGFGGSASAIRNAFSDILRQIDGTIYEDPIDGEIHLKLIRQDYNLFTVPVLDVTNITEVPSYSINLWNDTKNKIRGTFTDRQRDYKSDAVTVAEDMSNIGFQGTVKPMTPQYPHVKRSAHATRRVATDLAVFSTPIANIQTTHTRFNASLRPGDVVVMNYPEYKISNLVLRITKVDLGDLVTSRLALNLVSDKYAKTEAIYGVPGPGGFVKPSLSATTVTVARTLEAPLWFVSVQESVVDPDAPRVMALPKRPNGTQLSYDLYAKVTGEADYAKINTDIDFAAHGVLYASYPFSYDYDNVTGIELTSLDDATVLEIATVGQITTLGLNLIMIDDEILAFENFSLNGFGRYVLTGVYRGLLDTVPAAHSASARVIWLAPENVGSREFTVGDDVSVVIASKAPAGVQDDTNGLEMTVPETV